MKRALLAVLCLALSAVCISSQLVAAPHYGTPWQLKQPNGTLVDVRIFGDEYYQVVETPDGYTLVRDPGTGWIVYANLSADGNELVPTNVRYGGGSAALAGVSQHIRINPDVARTQAAQMRSQAFGGNVPENMRIGGGPSPAPPSTGNVTGLVLLADFSDINGTITLTEVQNYCNQDGYSNNGNNGSVQNYFEDVSNGALNYTCVVNDYHEGLGGSFAAYYDDCAQPWLSRAVELIKEILDEMDAAGHDFSVYDANGDNEIDAINLYFAGNGTVCGWAKGMWPGAGGMGGNGWTFDGKLANRFQITNMGTFLTLGTFCHENGHMTCGWPDLYDYDGDSAGAGGYDIMCNLMNGLNPVEPSAELKRSAGWTTPTLLPGAPTTGLTLNDANSNEAYRWTKNGNEWYLIENRQKTGRDASLPTSGLALWHIDTNGNNSAQQMTNAQHYYVTLVQADGDWDLEGNINQGDFWDLYKSNNETAATPCTDPNTDWWDGTQSNLSITNVGASQAQMTFDFSDEDNAPVAQVQDFSANADDDCCITVSVSDIDSLSYDPDGPGDIASLCITMVDGDAVSCVQSTEVCGEGDHQVRLTITDLCGNTSYADANVEVIDATPPTISIEMSRDALWPPNHKLVEVCATVTAEDNCDGALDIVLEDVYSDEPDNDKGDGNTLDDIQNETLGDDDLCFDLRSERMGGGDGRCYTIVYSATDNAGNSTADTVCVEVPHDQGASAHSSFGFQPDGANLISNANTFAVVIPGSSLLDVNTIDKTRIEVGNTAASIRAYRARTVDVNNDGLLDIAALFEATEKIFAPAESGDMAAISLEGEVLDARIISDGPIGLHFTTDSGTSYLVSNIYALGAPVVLPESDAGKDGRKPGVLTTPAQPAAERKVTALTSVHPNPFNPQTTVHFTLASQARVQIAIYDVTGALVRRLVDESMPAGEHQARWDGMNDAGRGATTGVYFVRMVAGSYTEVRKIVMLK